VDIDSVGFLATEVAAVLELLVSVRWAEGGARTPQESASLDVLRRVADRLPRAPEPVRATVHKLLAMADELLEGTGIVAA
jgi:hypothetical protein